MQSPYLIIVGEAGSGKDTLASFLSEFGYQAIAQADPMKRFAMKVFGFTEEQLWGPSECRNAEDPRFNPKVIGNAWGKVQDTLNGVPGLIAETLPEVLFDPAGSVNGDYIRKLRAWADKLEGDFYDSGRILTPRAMLQTFGTEFGRTLDPDVWSRQALQDAKKLLLGGYTYDRKVGLIRGNHPGYSNVVITDGRFRNEVLNVLELGGRSLKLMNPKDESASVEKAGIAGHKSEAEQKGIPDSWYTYTYTNDKALGLETFQKFAQLIAKPKTLVY